MRYSLIRRGRQGIRLCAQMTTCLLPRLFSPQPASENLPSIFDWGLNREYIAVILQSDKDIWYKILSKVISLSPLDGFALLP